MRRIKVIIGGAVLGSLVWWGSAGAAQSVPAGTPATPATPAAPAAPGVPGGAVFTELTRDFGSVPKGTILQHHFKLTNNFGSTLHVSGLRTSCGVCSSASVEKFEVGPGESTRVTVTVDTNKFDGPRDFTVFVSFDRPQLLEGRLVLRANSRSDVNFNPPQLAFGTVKLGSKPVASIAIEYHGGLADWQITKVENDNGYVQAKVEEVSRSLGLVVYRLTVGLRQDTPAGAWHADLWLDTSDPTAPKMRVPLQVEIEKSLTATPSEVNLGDRLVKGSQVEKRVTIRGTQPFKVLKVEGTDGTLQVAGLGDEAKAVHVLKLTFSADSDTGEINKRLRIVTDLPQDGAVEVTVHGQMGS